MTQKATHAYGERIMEAWKGKTPRERNELFGPHEQGYRLVDGMGAGFIDPDGLTEAGTAEVDKLAAALGVEPDDHPKPSKKGSKKDESNQ